MHALLHRSLNLNRKEMLMPSSSVNTPLNTQVQHTKDAALPLPPTDGLPETKAQEYDLAVYARFMRYLRHVPNNRIEIKILSAILFTADMMDHSDAHIAKSLVDWGLRAPRLAFPAGFLEYADAALMREDWEVGAASSGLMELRAYWDKIGEDKFAGFKKQYSLIEEQAAY
jgi:hypothetical protein